jgi:hypothetical protein
MEWNGPHTLGDYEVNIKYCLIHFYLELFCQKTVKIGYRLHEFNYTNSFSRMSIYIYIYE